MKKNQPPVSCMPAYRVRQRGASLIEGIAYLGIAALVVLGAVSLLTGAFGSAKANQTTEEIVALRTALRKLYVGQVPTANPVPEMIAANAVPNTLARGANDTLVNGWGGTVAIAVTGGTFTITYPNVPRDVCVGVVNGANGWTRIAHDTNGTGAIAAFPVPVATATTFCNAATSDIVFTAI